MEYPERCPQCDAWLQGFTIPESSREFFGGRTYFSRVIGIYNIHKDITESWRCPDCGHEWPRS